MSAGAPPLMVELDQCIGFAGGVPHGLHVLPSPASHKLLYAVGACAVVSDEGGAGHAQQFLRGHSANVTSLTLSPSARLIATGQRGDADICVWDASTLTLRARYEEHDEAIVCLAFSHDERLLLSIGADGALLVWDLASGCIVTRYRHEPAPTVTAAFGGFVRDVKQRDTGLYQFVTGGKSALHLWALNPLDGRVGSDRISSPGLSRDFLCVAFAPGGRYVYGGSSSGDVVVVSVASRSVASSTFASGGGICSILPLPSGPSAWLTLCVGTGDGNIVIYKHAVGGGGDDDDAILASMRSRGGGGGGASSAALLPHMTVRVPQPSPVWSLAHMPSLTSGGVQAVLAGCASGTMYRVTFDATASGAAVAAPPASRPVRNASSWSTAPVAASTPGVDASRSSVSLIRQAHGAAGDAAHGLPDWAALSVPVSASPAHAGAHAASSALAVALPGLPAALASSGRVCDVTGVAFADGVSDRFVTCATDNTVRLWDAAEYKCLQSIVVRGGGHPTCVVFAHEFHISGWQDGHLRAYMTVDARDAVRSAETVEATPLWTLPDAHPLREGGVTALALAHNQRFFVSGGANGGIRLWDMRTRAMVTQFREHAGAVTGLLLYPSDTHLLSVSKDRSLMSWDLRAGKRVSCHAQKMGAMHAVALTRDGACAITSSQDRRITFWDLRSTLPLREWAGVHAGHTRFGSAPPGRDVDGGGEATCMHVAHTRDVLATGGTDGVVKVWDLSTGACIAECVAHSACIRSVRFSPDDRQLLSVATDGAVNVWNVYQ